MFKEVAAEEIEVVLNAEKSSPYPIPEQFGPLRHKGKEMRCASRGCGSSTFFTVLEIPRCMIHALRELNQMLVDLGQV